MAAAAYGRRLGGGSAQKEWTALSTRDRAGAHARQSGARGLIERARTRATPRAGIYSPAPSELARARRIGTRSRRGCRQVPAADLENARRGGHLERGLAKTRRGAETKEEAMISQS